MLQVYLGTGERVQELSRILLCSSKGLRTMARRYPPLLLMEPEDLLHRMLALKVWPPALQSQILFRSSNKILTGLHAVELLSKCKNDT